MNFQIISGFKLPNMSMLELMNHVVRLQLQVKPLVKSKYIKSLAEIAAAIYDNHTLAGKLEELKKNSVLNLAYNNMVNLRNQARQAGRHESRVDFEFKMVFFPLSDGILGIADCAHKDLLDLWFNQTFVEEYGFASEAKDPAAVVSQEAWEKRRVDWSRVLSGAEFIEERGLIVSVTENQVSVSLKEVLDSIPPLSLRSEEQAVNTLFGDRVSKYSQEELQTILPKELEEFNKWLETEEGKSAIRMAMETISGKLQAVIAGSDLTIDEGKSPTV